MPVYILIVEDGNEHSEIVAFWLAASEDRTTIKQKADLVIHHNPCASQVSYTVTCKDQGNKGKLKRVETVCSDINYCWSGWADPPNQESLRHLNTGEP